MLDKIWDFLVRQRTRLFNAIGFLLMVAPDVLSAPEILAVLPPGYARYAFAAVFLINYWMRPHAAVRADDPEVQARKAADVETKITGEPVSLLIKSAGEKPVLVATVEPKAGGAK